ncbi:MAG: tRNA (N(6)-L-threonylcarbamoyladenosine(37)-C(2))-methylthiotransferase MtaB [Ruminococcaceae bacterium]|nr:tRNA (N(6)-L-threonylcarbamoyladenosine(37)-C(2))-methylthiotransferase MtaB [Oscillospiraceae bacterium]
MNYIIVTLGCKVNQYESHAMEKMLNEKGHTKAPAGKSADVIIINTCAVTAESGRKSRQAIRKLKQQNPNAVCAICGCWSQTDRQAAEAMEADIIYGSTDRRGLISEIEEYIKEGKNKPVTEINNPADDKEIEDLPAGAFSEHARAYLKIEDGCNNFCSYCIIPYARGRVRSIPPSDAIEKAKALRDKGYKEIVLTGIEIASYGKDLKQNIGLIDLVEIIAAEVPGIRLRLGSLETTIITEEFCKRLKSAGTVCDHFHMSLQSGSDSILKKMNRKYNTQEFKNAIDLLREHFEDCGITADLICGFPGETQAEHAESMRFIEACNFSDMHIFPYSIRPGTKAALLPNQLKKAEKAKRAAEANEIAKKSKQKFLESLKGKTLSVLFETESAGVSVGHATNYAQVCAEGEHLRGIVKSVAISSVSDEMLVGYLV